MPRTYADLLAIVDEAEIVIDQNSAATHNVSQNGVDAPIRQSNVSQNGESVSAAPEADDDPHRLARVNLERYASRSDGRKLAYWRDEWYVWKHNAYRKISERELRAKLSASIKEEFDRISREKQAMADGAGRDGDDPIQTQKVSMALVSNVMQATAGMTCVSAGVELNTWLPTKEHRHYVSMTNGLLDIDAVLADRDDYLVPNVPEWFSQVSLPYAFDPDAACPKWDAFLEHNLEMDPERIKVLQEWAGYLLVPTTDEQKFMVLEGEGRNGKSVFIAGLTAMLGEENVSNVALENFADRFQRTDTLGKLLNAAGDCGEIDKAAEGILKSFTAGDRMYFDRKGIAGLNCIPTARLMIAANNRPRFSDRSEGVWRRMLPIPWRVEITAEKCVKGMDKIAWWQRSGELPGIFNWALVGLARLRSQRGFTDSELIRTTLEDYKTEMNPARAFLIETYTLADQATVVCKTLYKTYTDWCKERGHIHPLSEMLFGKEVKRRFPTVKRERESSGERPWYYLGISEKQSY